MTTPILYNGEPSTIQVLGLDLSLNGTGVCRPDGTTYRIKQTTADGDRRLVTIRDHIRRDIATYRPHLAVLEDLPMHANSAGLTAMVQGVVRAELADAGVPYATISPATLKCFACDHGKAGKQQMADAAYLAAGATFPGDLNARGDGGDMCDAWWLRAAGHDWFGIPLFSLPEAQRQRLRTAKWPPRLRVEPLSGRAAEVAR